MAKIASTWTSKRSRGSIRKHQKTKLDKKAANKGSTEKHAKASDNLKGPLNKVIREPVGNHNYTLVYLHGFGSCATDFSWSHFDGVQELARLGIRVVLPYAPIRPITFMDGVEKRAWYDYKTNNWGNREDKADKKTLNHSIDLLKKLLDEELKLLDGDADRLFVGGASQGAIASLDLVMRYRVPVAGYIGIAGTYSLPKTPKTKRNVPLFFVNGSEDDIHDWKWTRATVQRFRRFAKTSALALLAYDHDELCSPMGRPFVAAFLRVMCSGAAVSLKKDLTRTLKADGFRLPIR